MNTRIITDSNSDLQGDYLTAHPLTVIPMLYRVGGQEYFDTSDTSDPHYLDPKEFYRRMRAEEPVGTSQLNAEDYIAAFRPVLEGGQDILYLAFSSGLSGSYNNSLVAADMLREEFPDRTIRIVDTLSAAMGQGLLVHTVLKKQAEGMTGAELEAWANEHKLLLHHWFTVDDLGHLRRGGRISAAVAVVGSMLSIKPVLDMNQEGKLISIENGKGRKRVLKTLVDKMEKYCEDPASYDIFISHGDCLDDAQLVADMVHQRFGVTVSRIATLCPTIAAHSGPGTVALFFFSKQKRV